MYSWLNGAVVISARLDKIWQVLIKVSYHSNREISIKIMDMGEYRWAESDIITY